FFACSRRTIPRGKKLRRTQSTQQARAGSQKRRTEKIPPRYGSVHSNRAIARLRFIFVGHQGSAQKRSAQTLRPRVERMFALLVKFVLNSQALVICLCRANGFDNGLDPILHVPFAELLRCQGAVTGIVIRESSVPPD